MGGVSARRGMRNEIQRAREPAVKYTRMIPIIDKKGGPCAASQKMPLGRPIQYARMPGQMSVAVTTTECAFTTPARPSVAQTPSTSQRIEATRVAMRTRSPAFLRRPRAIHVERTVNCRLEQKIYEDEAPRRVSET